MPVARPPQRTRQLCTALVIFGLWLAHETAPAAAQAVRAAVEPSKEHNAFPVAVFGADDRVLVPPRYAKLQDMLGVMFNIKARTVCTAFCVAEQVVATASHCLFRTTGEQAQRLSEFWFARNYDTVRDYARIAGHATGAASQNVLAGNRRLSVQPPIDATSDWALIRLSRPICTKGVLPVKAMTGEEVMREARAQRIFQISYHRDFQQWRLAYSKPCAADRNYPGAEWSTIAPDFSDPELLLLHTCDTGGASSGSPILVETSDGPKVAGINVGTYIQSRVTMQNGEATGRGQTETVANTAVSSTAFAGKIAALQAAEILMSAGEIKELQERLKQRQHYTGPINGTYGPVLKTAIEEFETASGVVGLGLATAAVLARLRAMPGGQQLPAVGRGLRIP